MKLLRVGAQRVFRIQERAGLLSSGAERRRVPIEDDAVDRVRVRGVGAADHFVEWRRTVGGSFDPVAGPSFRRVDGIGFTLCVLIVLARRPPGGHDSTGERRGGSAVHVPGGRSGVAARVHRCPEGAA
jgi:hypothetical protein